MAFLELHRKRLRHNHRFLKELFEKQGMDWGIVTKLLCGNETYLKEVTTWAKELHDTRISNLKAIKRLAPEVQTVYIKPPAKRAIPNVVRYADVSFNSDLTTIRQLSEEAVRQDRHHKVIIMVEMGDLREGVMGDELIGVLRRGVRTAPHQHHRAGHQPELPERHHAHAGQADPALPVQTAHRIALQQAHPWVTGGTTVTIPLLLKKQLPKGVNHFRVGEALFFGKDLFTNGTIKGMRNDVFRLHAEVIELSEKTDGAHRRAGLNVSGETPSTTRRTSGAPRSGPSWTSACWTWTLRTSPAR